MKKYSILLLIFVFAVNNFAQKNKNQKPDDKDKNTVSISKTSTPNDLAKAALKAHGGVKFKNMKTLVVKGTAEVSGSPTQVISATFSTTYSGDKYRLEVVNPLRPFSQSYDGQRTYSSIPNFSLPPLNRLGLPLLQKFDEKGYTVTALPEKSNKKLGFRITASDGYYTDFFLDEKTGQIKSYEASYDINGQTVTTSVEIDKLREVEGVLVPERYAQRFELGSLTMYADFKAKDIIVNSVIADEVFVVK